MLLLTWISLALSASVASSAEMVELHSPRLTYYGDWMGWAKCPTDTYAAGLQIKDAIEKEYIMSGEGPFGDWQAIKWCPRGQVIVGFQMRSEPDQGYGDDVAADNIAAFCGSPFSSPDHNNWISGDTVGWGHWTAKQFCPQAYAVCAIDTQIEKYQGEDGDDTTLNNVNLGCCEVNYTCKPDAELVTMEWFDNRLATKP